MLFSCKHIYFSLQDLSAHKLSAVPLARRASNPPNVQYGMDDDLDEELNVGRNVQVEDEQSDSLSVSSYG